MLIDDITLKIKAGDGGNGAVSFLRTGQVEKGGPDGGNGGNGGNIFFKGSNNINDLSQFRYKKEINADNGVNGGKYKLFGKNADHTIILLPIGTNVTDLGTNRTFEINNNNEILVARGGKGGRGNTEFKSSTKQSPKYAESGAKGQQKELHLELKFIADVGLIGLPNAGKSSLLGIFTNAKPKIGNFPFTTLEPNLGMYDKLMIADIPGLIDGAADGKGLGIKFLKHIEKTKILIHCISIENEEPRKIYETVRNELKNYNEELIDKKEIILVTKTDLADEDKIKKVTELLKPYDKEVQTISIYDEDSINKFKNYLSTLTK